jgi:hypothetical protein
MGDLSVFGYLISPDVRKHILMDYPDASENEIEEFINHGKPLWVLVWFADKSFSDAHERINARVVGDFEYNRRNGLIYTGCGLADLNTKKPTTKNDHWAVPFTDFSSFSAGKRSKLPGSFATYIYDVCLYGDRSPDLNEGFPHARLYVSDGPKPMAIQLPSNVVF